MKPALSFYLSLLLFLMFSGNAIGQTKRSEGKGFENATILWKISGKDCKQPSYLLGTFHLTDADWLYEYPEMKKVIENTELLLTEKFTTIPADTQPSHVIKLKAVPLLTDQQYQILDSFFVARTGEGITGNDEAENMTVAEMGSAILVTLASNAKGPNGITKYMDLDLFTRYQKLGRKVDRLDRITSAEFDSDHVEHAKQHLARSISYIKNSDKSDWNVYQMKGVEEAVADYK